jgi:transcriptional regulator with XRE-family HTH domain
LTVEDRFAANLIRARKRTRLSQDALALRASLDPATVGKLERGEQLARVDTFLRLAGALSIRPGELLDGIDWEPGHSERGTYTLLSNPP